MPVEALELPLPSTTMAADRLSDRDAAAAAAAPLLEGAAGSDEAAGKNTALKLPLTSALPSLPPPQPMREPMREPCGQHKRRQPKVAAPSPFALPLQPLSGRRRRDPGARNGPSVRSGKRQLAELPPVHLNLLHGRTGQSSRQSIPHYSALELNRQKRQARRKAREMEEAFVQQADGEMFYRLREKERGSAPAS